MYINKENYTMIFTNKIISEIVAEQDEYIISIIEDYVKKARANGECVSERIIPEGKLRHILNLGMTIYAKQNNIDVYESDLLPEQKYVEYLRRENEELRKKLNRIELSD